MSSWIKPLLTAPYFEDPHRQRTANLLSNLLWGILAVELGISVILIVIRLRGIIVPLAVEISGAAFLFTFTLVYLLRRGWPRLASALLIASLFGSIVVLDLKYGGVRSPLTIFFLAVIVVAGLLLDGLGAIVVGLLSMVVTLGLYLAEAGGIYSPRLLPSGLLMWIAYGLGFGLTALILHLATNRIREAIDQLIQRERALADGNRELQTVRSTLEERLKEHESTLRHQDTLAKAVGELALESTTIRAQAELLRRVASLIERLLPYEFAAIYLLDESGDHLTLRAATGDVGRQIQPSGHRWKTSQLGVIGEVALRGVLQVFNEMNPSVSTPGAHLLAETRAQCVLPLRTSERHVGVLDLQSYQQGVFTEFDTGFLMAFADQLSSAIDCARLTHSLNSRLQELEMSLEGSGQASWQNFVQRIPGGQGYRYRKASQDQGVADLPGQRSPLDAFAQSPAEDHDERSDLSLPIRLRNRQIGQLNLRIKEDADTEETLTLIEEASNRLALALENARLLEQIRLRSDQLELLQEVTATAASHVDLQLLLNAVANKLLQGLDLLHVGVLLFDADSRLGTLVADASASPSTPGADVIGTRISIEDDRVTREIIGSRRSVVIYDVQRDPSTTHIHDLMQQRGTQTLVVVPLISRNEVIGTISLDTADPGRRFSDQDLALLDQISLQIASAIDVARLFERTIQRAERERLVTEITTKMRASNDPQAILQTAVRELKLALKANQAQVQFLPRPISPARQAGNHEQSGENGAM